jgi:hypothetical protein
VDPRIRTDSRRKYGQGPPLYDLERRVVYDFLITLQLD